MCAHKIIKSYRLFGGFMKSFGFPRIPYFAGVEAGSRGRIGLEVVLDFQM